MLTDVFLLSFSLYLLLILLFLLSHAEVDARIIVNIYRLFNVKVMKDSSA
jgi:hypothetical protein